MLIHKLYFTLAFIIFSAHSIPDNNDAVYNSSVSAVGFISDRSGAIASGFFINENTFITNHHVTSELDIESANIEMKDGSSYSVRIIINEYGTIDLAIIQTNEQSQHVLKLEDKIKPEKNDEVYSIGNPTDSKQHVDYFKVTSGRIKKIAEDEWYYDKGSNDEHKALVIQHTAVIKPGNSGGPLMNKFGRVIGINTFFYDDSLNYAIHVDELIKVLKKNGIKYNETVHKSDTKNKTKKLTFNKRLEYIIDRHEYFLRTYSLLVISAVLLYYMFAALGAIIILAYISVKVRKR